MVALVVVDLGARALFPTTDGDVMGGSGVILNRCVQCGEMMNQMERDG